MQLYRDEGRDLYSHERSIMETPTLSFFTGDKLVQSAFASSKLNVLFFWKIISI